MKTPARFPRATVRPENRAAYEEAVKAAAKIFAYACRDMDELAAIGGPEAVAEAAYVPGGPSKEQIAAEYRQMQDEARELARRGSAA